MSLFQRNITSSFLYRNIETKNNVHWFEPKHYRNHPPTRDLRKLWFKITVQEIWERKREKWKIQKERKGERDGRSRSAFWRRVSWTKGCALSRGSEREILKHSWGRFPYKYIFKYRYRFTYNQEEQSCNYSFSNSLIQYCYKIKFFKNFWKCLIETFSIFNQLSSLATKYI